VASDPGISFVCCVESGWLEYQTVRLVESLRRFGGRFADAPLFAVTPRFGPPLSRATQNVFRACGVKHIRATASQQYAWFNYFNKPLALVSAEEHIRTESVGFLDSDLLIVKEPEQLELAPGEDLLAFPMPLKEMGTTGPGDPYEEFWRASCKVAGIELEALPWVTTAQTQERVRLYFNSGIFVYRRASGFSKEYLRLCRALLDSAVGTDAPNYGLGFKEQVSVAFAAMTLDLKWRALPYSHNYPMFSGTHEHWYSLELLKDARVVHYHDAMWPPFWGTFLRCMQDAQPEAASWLYSLGPMKNDSPLHWRLISRYLRMARRRKAERYRASCMIY
jgi:hypothetical protein